MYVLSFHVMSLWQHSNTKNGWLCFVLVKKNFTADHTFENKEFKFFGIFKINLVEEMLEVSWMNRLQS